MKGTFEDWQKDKAPKLGAALAYYTVFSLAPLLVIVLAIVGLFFSQDAAQRHMNSQLQDLLGARGAEAVQSLIASAGRPGNGGIVATVLGVVALLFGASGVFGELQDSLNTIWKVRPKPNRGILGIMRSRFLSFTMVLGIGFLLLVSLVVSAALSAFSGMISQWMPGIEIAGPILNFVVSFLVITLLFAMIFKFLPDVEIGWRDVWLGAATTSLLFQIGKSLIGLYLGRPAVSSAYGAAGSVVLVLLWSYYSAQILFFGAEFTQVYARMYGSRIRPAPNAEPITEELRAQQGLHPKPA